MRRPPRKGRTGGFSCVVRFGLIHVGSFTRYVSHESPIPEQGKRLDRSPPGDAELLHDAVNARYRPVRFDLARLDTRPDDAGHLLVHGLWPERVNRHAVHRGLPQVTTKAQGMSWRARCAMAYHAGMAHIMNRRRRWSVSDDALALVAVVAWAVGTIACVVGLLMTPA